MDATLLELAHDFITKEAGNKKNAYSQRASVHQAALLAVTNSMKR